MDTIKIPTLDAHSPYNPVRFLMYRYLVSLIQITAFLTFFALPKWGVGQADFSSSITTGCNPQIVNFTSTAPGAVSYNWNFGNGNFSALANPGATYTSPGTYTVTLTVTYGNGSTETVTKPGYITIYANPNSEFTANIFNICQGESVQFTDLSTPGSNPITGWLWDFGDGDTSVLSNPNHTFAVPGVFAITLVTSDVNGCSDIEQKTGYIFVNPTPNADFTVDNALGCTTPFSPNFTSFPNPPGLTHTWTLGNGTFSSQVNPSTTYNNPGNYTVSHIVTDTLGCSDTVTKVNLISVGNGTLNIQANDYLVCPFQVVSFFCNGPPGALVSWNFGLPGAISNVCNPTYTYSTPGTYVVSATVVDGNGCSFTGSTIITVSTPPVVDFTTLDTLLCNPPWTVNFTNNTTGAVSYNWQFGNGAASSNPSPTYTYPTLPIFSQNGQPYFYDITLIATNADGCSSFLIKEDYIVTGQTKAEFIANPRDGCAPLNVQFFNFSPTPSTITSINWSFGNGQTDTVNSPLVTYNDTGYYNVKLIIETEHGCIDSVEKDSFIAAGMQPIADFEADTTYSCASGQIMFTNLSQNADSAFWIFGDGGSSTAWEPTYQFQDTGWMSVTLIAFDRGCPDTLVKSDYIYIDPPIARFFPNNLIRCTVPDTINFMDTSIGAHHWFWDFGVPGATSTLQNPSYTYTSEGTFIVTLIVLNDSTGCGDTTTTSVNIKTVEADFAPDTTSGCGPLTVNFSDSSNNAIQWFWNFGDGTGATINNPTHTYATPGIYSVKLFVQNSLNCLDDTTYNSLIKVYNPSADFGVLDQTGCVPFSVTFNDNSSSLAPITTWNWSFGPPGATSGAQSPTYTYTTPGLYSVSLTTIDSVGCSDTNTRPAYIYVTEPIADFSVAHPINCVNNPIFFVDQSSGVAFSHFWEFGDGNTSNVQNPIHSYTANGLYNAKLTITDINGCTSTDSILITIETPLVNFVADTTSADCPPLLVNFTATVFSSHTFSNWTWDFGDMSGSVVQNPSHLYVVPGDYDVTVVASTAAGCSTTVAFPDLIQVGGPYGSFSFGPQQVCPGDPVTFTGTGTANVASYFWDLGGGILDTGQVVNMGYTIPGIYYPALIVEDTSGCQVLLTTQDSIEVYALPVADFNHTAPVLCDMGVVNFMDQTSSVNPLISWEWDFGDNSPAAFGTNPSHTYSSPGSYDVRLIVTTIHGCTDTIVKPAYITVHSSPEVVIGVSDSMGCEPFAVQFTDLSPSTNFPIQTWDWNFGIFGANSTTQNPTYTYNNDGTYLAFLLVTDSNGCTGSDDQNITVWPLPEPDFVADDSFGCAPKIVQFTDLTPTSTSWEWTFGDNSPISIQNNPTHTYQVNGIYSVTLQVWDANGCTASLTKPNYINLDHPEANFSVSNRVTCPGVDLNFFDQTQSDTTIVSWDWDFGDNMGTSNQQNPVYAYSNSGFYDITLTVTDVFGCMSTITQTAYIEVLINEVPIVPSIKYVTVTGDDEVHISYERYANLINDFNQYIIYRQDGSGNWVQVHSTTNINETTWTNSSLDTRQNSYCYKIQVENYCGLTSDLNDSETHCSILLTTTAQVDQILVDWSDYVGWNEVEFYELYRVNGYGVGNIDLIATLPGTQTAFTDTNMFCYDDYTYRVKALELGSEEVSWSNIQNEAPIHFGPQNPINMTLATVEENNYLLIRWDDIPEGDDLVWVEIEKNSGNGYQQILRISVNDTTRSLEDRDVDVSSQFYRYRAFVVDTCGDYTPVGLVSTSIHLQAERDNGIVFLKWSPYAEWEFGVDRYEIEVFNETTAQFENVGSVLGNVTEFVDDKTDLNQASYCYRVIAYEVAGNVYASYSNEACVLIDPLLFFPNAFTPNQDLFNDRFLIPGVFLDQFRMEIYNRWGEKIYETTNIEEGWDGTSNGVAVPEGVYVFKAFGLGYSGQVIERAGTVTLIR